MTALSDVHLSWLTLLAIVALLVALLLIAFAIYTKDHVKTGLRFFSFGFFLEADGANPAGRKARSSSPRISKEE